MRRQSKTCMTADSKDLKPTIRAMLKTAMSGYRMRQNLEADAPLTDDCGRCDSWLDEYNANALYKLNPVHGFVEIGFDCADGRLVASATLSRNGMKFGKVHYRIDSKDGDSIHGTC